MDSSWRRAWSRSVAIIAATLTLVAAPLAVALAQVQPNQVQPAPPSEIPTLPRLKLTTQDEYTIREIILTDAGIPKQSSAPENIGDIVPQNIRLSPLPSDVVQKVPKARGHEFFVKDDAVFLVSPSDRRIADVLRKKPND
jgi:hypothetical protein